MLSDESSRQDDIHARRISALAMQLKEREQREAAEVLRYASELNRASMVSDQRSFALNRLQTEAAFSSIAPNLPAAYDSSTMRLNSNLLRRMAMDDRAPLASSGTLHALLDSMTRDADRLRQQHVDALT